MATSRSARVADHPEPVSRLVPRPTRSGAKPATVQTKRGPSWLLISFLGLAAVLAALGVWCSLDQPTQPMTFVVAPALPTARACVTRYGFCPVGMVRAGDPCRCPDTLRGSVPGHVELISGAVGQGSGRHWPNRLGAEPRETLGPRFGP